VVLARNPIRARNKFLCPLTEEFNKNHKYYSRNQTLLLNYIILYSRKTSTKFPSFCMTNFSASLTNITVLLPQSHDRNCYVSTRILAPPSLTAETHKSTPHDFAHSPGW
jgi:hypothetical protein